MADPKDPLFQAARRAAAKPLSPRDPNASAAAAPESADSGLPSTEPDEEAPAAPQPKFDNGIQHAQAALDAITDDVLDGMAKDAGNYTTEETTSTNWRLLTGEIQESKKVLQPALDALLSEDASPEVQRLEDALIQRLGKLDDLEAKANAEIARLEKAAPQQQAPAPIPSAAPAAAAPTAPGNLADAINQPIRKAENLADTLAVEIGEEESHLTEIEQGRADASELKDMKSRLLSDIEDISDVYDDLVNDKSNPPGASDAAKKQLDDLKTKALALIDRIDQAASKPPVAAQGAAAASPAPSLTQGIASRPQSSAVVVDRKPMFKGFEKVAEEGDVSVNLESELKASRERINRRILEIFDTLSRASERALDKRSYDFKGGSVVVAPSPDPTRPEDDMENAAQTVADFATIAAGIPQMVANLERDFTYANQRYEAVVGRKPMPVEPPPVTVEPWDLTKAKRLDPPPPIQLEGPVQTPEDPESDVGGQVVNKTFKIGAQRFRALREQKERIDTQMVVVLDTINEILTSATEEDSKSAYKLEGEFMQVNVDTWESTRDTAKLLVPIMQRLVSEVQTLIDESNRTAEMVARVGEDDSNQ